MELNIHYTSSAASTPVPTAAQLYGGVFHAALIVADDVACADRMRRILCELAPHRRVVIASGRAEAFNLLAALPYDLVLVDMRVGAVGHDQVAQVGQARRQVAVQVERDGDGEVEADDGACHAIIPPGTRRTCPGRGWRPAAGPRHGTRVDPADRRKR